MSTALITGSAGLIGSEAARHFHELGFEVIGIDNDMRGVFFGPEASTQWMSERLEKELPRYRHCSEDIRDGDAMARLTKEAGSDLELIIHTAAQPSHDWSALHPAIDFAVNALGTLNVLEAAREHAPEATVIFTSTNKVYGDTPNRLPLIETETRYDLPEDHPWFNGITTAMSIDRSTHSLFGVSKAAADLMVQEYGRYFGLRTASFRGGCLTGPRHAGTELHGFLAYLMKCTVLGRPYTVFGYKGKQVRDNIHSGDLVAAFECVAARPVAGAVYNIGGGRACNCSMLEAIAMCERIADRELTYEYTDRNRVGDHLWWVSDLSEFQADYPEWAPRYDIEAMLTEIFELNRERWLEEARA